MARTLKRSIIQNTRQYEEQKRRRRNRRGRNIVLLLLFLGMFVLGFNRVIAYEDNISRRTFTVEGNLPVPVLEMYPATGETSLVAVVAHGFSGSKELMASFGVELARAGVTAYLFDFPGHGESPVPLANDTFSGRSFQDNIIAVGEVVAYARTHNRATSHPNIILLGHSMGSAAVGDYAMAHPDEGDIAATILISPVGQEHPTLTQPKNLLILAGDSDIPYAISNGLRLYQAGCGQGIADIKTTPVQCGNPADGTGRRVVVLPGLNHITILNSSSTFQEMVNWLHGAFPQAVDTSHMQSNLRLFWLLFAVIGILLAVFPLCSLALDAFDIFGRPRSFRGQDVLFFDLCVIVGIAAAIAIQYAWRPFSFFHVLLTDYVSGYFFFIALVTALGIYLIRRMIPLPPFRQTTKQIILGVLLALFLYLTLGQLVTFAWQRFTFTLPRLWRFALIFIVIWPLFLLDEGINRGYQEHGVLRGVLASLGFKALLAAGLFASIVIVPGLSFLGIVLPVLVLVFLMMVAFCTQLYTSGRAAITAATFSALVMAWCMSTTFPITA